MQRCEVVWPSVWRPSSTKPRSRPSPRRSSTPMQRMLFCLKPSPSSSTMTGWSHLLWLKLCAGRWIPGIRQPGDIMKLRLKGVQFYLTSFHFCALFFLIVGKGSSVQCFWILKCVSAFWLSCWFCMLSLSEPTLLVRACNQLGQFLQHRETNLRYLALESMCTLASSEFSHETVKTHIETVINALKVSHSTVVSLR